MSAIVADTSRSQVAYPFGFLNDNVISIASTGGLEPPTVRPLRPVSCHCSTWIPFMSCLITHGRHLRHHARRSIHCHSALIPVLGRALSTSTCLYPLTLPIILSCLGWMPLDVRLISPRPHLLNQPSSQAAVRVVNVLLSKIRLGEPEGSRTQTSLQPQSTLPLGYRPLQTSILTNQGLEHHKSIYHIPFIKSSTEYS